MAPVSFLPSPSLKNAKKRGTYSTMTMEKKAAIIRQVQDGRSQAEVAREFGISKQTVSDYVKNKAKIQAACEKASGCKQKNLSKGSHPQLEEALYMWLSATVAKRVPVSGDLLKKKAENFALQMGIEGFKCSDGWLRNFKRRHDLAFKKMCGESGAVDQTIVSGYTDRLHSLLRRYSPEDVFNCDETGLFYKMMPERTLALSGDPCHGGKHSKERITVLVGSNMSGTEKLPLLVIGKSKNPRCFKGMKSLPVWYEANKKAWITQELFERYIRRLDRKFELEQRKVLLFVDNCAAHGHIDKLNAIEMEFLPPNTTSVLQPMDQGVIQNLKVHYRSRLLSRVVLCLDSGKNYAVNLLSALGIVADAWKAVTADTLKNCFRHAGFSLNAETAEMSDAHHHDAAPDDISPSGDDLLAELRTGGVEMPTSVTFDKFVDMDDALLSCAELSDDEIVRQVLDQSESGSDTDTEEPDTAEPSNSELMKALAVLSSVYSAEMSLREVEADVIKRRWKNVRQESINTFFKPTSV